MPVDPEFWTRTLSGYLEALAAWVPSLVGALALLVLGWIVARILQAIFSGLLRRLGLDRLADRAGVAEVLTQSGLEPSASHLVARFAYWIVLLLFILAAAESLGLQGVANALSAFVSYLPSVLAAVLILLLGAVIARLVGDALAALATQSGLAAGPALGQGIRYGLLIFVVILALEQLGIETSLLTSAVVAIIGATALALAVAFGMGSRGLARNIMAGFHAKDAFTIGQVLELRGHTGKLVSIGTVKSVIDTEAGPVSLPNHLLIEEEVRIVPEDDT